jgi:agmatinase
LYSKLDLDESEAMGFAAVHCRDFVRSPIDDIIDRVRARLGDRPVYVSVDIDVLDPAFAPGTGTPEAGGLSSAQLLEVLRGLAGLAVVGADVVEVAPAYDHAEITGIAAAHTAYELLSLLPGRPR